MHRTLYLFLIIVTAISCNLRNANNNYEFPKQVIISGRILNYNKENSKIRLFVPRLGLEGINIYEDIDSLGQFTAKFDSYTPTDVGIVYKTNFLVLTHPGDSIYIEFDGKAQQRVELLTSIKFSGDAAIQNQNVAKFQSMFYSNPIFYDRETINSAVKELEMNEYITYLDSQQNIRSKLYDQFIAEVNPNTETKIWAKTLLDQDYYDDLGFYPVDHKSYNNLTNEEWSIPISYYDNLKKRLPITKSMLISSSALSRFINRYHYDYVYNNIWEEEENQIYKRNDGNIGGPGDILDSIHVYGIIKHTPDELLKQMVLTELIAQNFEKSDIHLFEQYRHVIESNITEPFLIKPLLQKYNEIKGHLENPEIRSDAVLNKIGNSSAKQIMDSIMISNKGKVIYIDCWATWCAPCLVEMPYSKELMKKMQGKDVVFVYLCLDSEEKIWKASLADLQLTGQHFYLTKEQSTDFRKAFDVNGIPHYFIIDKKGNITEKGSHLRPRAVEDKIALIL